MTTFLIIGGIGLVILLVSVVFGEAIEGIFDLDFLGGDLFSAAGIAAFLGAFGFSGVISLALLDITWIAILVGLVAGGIAFWGAAALTRWLKAGENHAVVRSDALVGASGRVITAIPEGSYGEVMISVGGRTLKRSARADVSIPSGVEVWVSGIVSPTAVQVTPSRELRNPASEIPESL